MSEMMKSLIYVYNDYIVLISNHSNFRSYIQLLITVNIQEYI